jgi:hypothetical protein
MTREILGEVLTYVDDELVNGEFSPPSDWETVLFFIDFAVDLEPGEYELLRLEIDDPDWGSGIPILTGNPSFTVADSGCTYIGLLNFNLYRLPPGSFEEQQVMASEASATLGVEILMMFLGAGSLFGESANAFVPEESERPDSALGCAVQGAEFPG